MKSGRASDRRRSPRSTGIEEHGIVAARVKPGRDALIVNISPEGALIETFYRLLPGTIVDLQLDRSARRLVVRGRVIRCSVAAVRASAVVYRGAIAFERTVPWLADEADGNQVPAIEQTRDEAHRAAATRDAASESSSGRQGGTV